jgi:hypothetical protein
VGGVGRASWTKCQLFASYRVAWIVLHDWKKAPMALDASKKIWVSLLPLPFFICEGSFGLILRIDVGFLGSLSSLFQLVSSHVVHIRI